MTAQSLYRVENLPVLQNKVFSSAEEAKNSTVGDVVLCQNPKTGIVENTAFNPELLVYDQSYQNEQGVSACFQQHLEQVKDIVIQQLGHGSLIEVGCGKGHFLKMLRENGITVKGVDAAYEGNDPDIIKSVFRPGIGFQGEAIVLRHVLEHIQDPVSFLQSLAEDNHGGLIYIEVPCFDWIMQNNAWIDIFYEHVNYFRLEDFDRIFSTVKSSGHLFGGQYMYVVADLDSLSQPDNMPNFKPVAFPEKFLNSLTTVTDYLKNKKSKIAVWGAASKGVIFTLFAARHDVMIDYIVDINPAKQNKYIPVSGLPVSAPEVIMADPEVQEIIIMNSNYSNEIKELMGKNYNYLEVDKNEL